MGRWKSSNKKSWNATNKQERRVNKYLRGTAQLPTAALGLEVVLKTDGICEICGSRN